MSEGCEGGSDEGREYIIEQFICSQQLHILEHVLITCSQMFVFVGLLLNVRPHEIY